jgi:hypothetical protein
MQYLLENHGAHFDRDGDNHAHHKQHVESEFSRIRLLMVAGFDWRHFDHRVRHGNVVRDGGSGHGPDRRDSGIDSAVD